MLGDTPGWEARPIGAFLSGLLCGLEPSAHKEKFFRFFPVILASSTQHPCLALGADSKASPM